MKKLRLANLLILGNLALFHGAVLAAGTSPVVLDSYGAADEDKRAYSILCRNSGEKTSVFKYSGTNKVCFRDKEGETHCSTEWTIDEAAVRACNNR